MKRLYLFLLTALLLLPLFCSCVMTGEDETLTARVIRIYPDADVILLAPMDMSEGQPPLFLYWEFHESLAEGDCIVLTYRGGMTEEKSPYLNAPVYRPKKTVSVTTDVKRFDNLAAIYLSVLTDLSKEEGNNIADHAMLAVSLEETALPPCEQSAVVYAIAKQYPTVSVIEESRADLMAKGFMTKTPDGHRWYWKDGTFLAIYEYPKKCTDRTRYFNADLGHGYVWTGCRTSRDADTGVWMPYEKGGIAYVD